MNEERHWEQQPLILVVHLETAPPQYLQTHLERLRMQFAQDLLFVTDRPPSPRHKDFCIQLGELFLNSILDDLPANLKTYTLRPKLWKNAYVRLLVAAQISLEMGRNVILLESDVIVLDPQAIRQLGTLGPGLHFPMVSQDVGIASTLAIIGHEAAAALPAELEALNRDGLPRTEMEMLGALMSHKTIARPLPRGSALLADWAHSSAGDLEVTAERGSKRLGSPDEPTKYQSVFDGAALGRYFIGTNPLHCGGLVKVRTVDHSDVVDPRRGSWASSREDGQIVLYDDKSLLKVATLHAASKEPQLFCKSGRALERRISKTIRGGSQIVSVRPMSLLPIVDVYRGGVARRFASVRNARRSND